VTDLRIFGVGADKITEGEVMPKTTKSGKAKQSELPGTLQRSRM
jgi:hypothetical protein